MVQTNLLRFKLSVESWTLETLLDYYENFVNSYDKFIIQHHTGYNIPSATVCARLLHKNVQAGLANLGPLREFC
jgi:hypothetical protein